jgi:predicted protein tyrosine phosphatase
MRILFVCNQNRHRSRTAEELFADTFETRSAGLFGGTPVTDDLLAWADVVVVMSEEQRALLAERFPKSYLRTRIIDFAIPNVYAYRQPALVALLRKRGDELLQPLTNL